MSPLAVVRSYLLSVFLNDVQGRRKLFQAVGIYVRASIHLLTLITTRIKTFTLSTLALSSENVLHRNIQPTFSHLSPNSSMVRASHRRSEGCGFESRLGNQEFF